jgi:hypothetical protein
METFYEIDLPAEVFLGRTVRRSRVLAGMGTREELAEKTALPVEKIAGLEKGNPKVMTPAEVRRVFSEFKLGHDEIVYIDRLIENLFSVPLTVANKVTYPLTNSSRRLPHPRARASYSST